MPLFFLCGFCDSKRRKERCKAMRLLVDNKQK